MMRRLKGYSARGRPLPLICLTWGKSSRWRIQYLLLDPSATDQSRRQRTTLTDTADIRLCFWDARLVIRSALPLKTAHICFD